MLCFTGFFSVNMQRKNISDVFMTVLICHRFHSSMFINFSFLNCGPNGRSQQGKQLLMHGNELCQNSPKNIELFYVQEVKDTVWKDMRASS